LIPLNNISIRHAVALCRVTIIIKLIGTDYFYAACVTRNVSDIAK